MRFSLARSSKANRDIDALDLVTQSRILERLSDLQVQPYALSKALKGKTSLRSSRVGDWRILFEVDSDEGVVVIDRIRHRREVYRGL